MKRRKDILDYDPVVEDVRRWRRSLQRKAGGTLGGLVRLMEQREAEERLGGGPSTNRRAGPKRTSRAASTPKRRKRAA